MLELLLNALTLFSILVLVALGLAIVFGLMNIINMAHGEFVMIGAFTLSLVQSAGGGFWAGVAAACVVGAVLGLLLERLMIRHLYERPMAAILATFGVSLILNRFKTIRSTIPSRDNFLHIVNDIDSDGGDAAAVEKLIQ